MKKVILIAVILVLTMALLVGCSVPTKNIDKDPLVTEWNSYELLNSFVSSFPSRTSGDKATNAAGETKTDLITKWIGERMMSYGYSADNYGRQEFTYNNRHENNRFEQSYNLKFVKDNANADKKVIIGAHYDNAAAITVNKTTIGGEGVYNNAVSVIALLQLARELAMIELPFDVDFVFFGAGDMGQKGSAAYLSEMSATARENTLLMINYDRIVGGDYLYMYSDEVAWEHESFFYDLAESKSYNATPLPANKRPALYSTLVGSDMMYYNEFMLSDNMTFLSAGIPSISFTSMNASSRANAGYVEIDGSNNVDYTSADTLLEMKNRLGGAAKGEAAINSGIDTVVSITRDTLRGEDFVASMESSLANKPNYKGIANYETMQIISYSLTGVLIVVLLALYFVMKSKVTKHDVVVQTGNGYVNLTKGTITFNDGQAPSVDQFGGRAGRNIDPFSGNISNNDPFATPSGDPFDNSGVDPSANSGDNGGNKSLPNNNDDVFGDY